MKISLQNASFFKFILVGIINTIIGTSLMFLFYNIFIWGYWLSSGIAYIVASIVSYFFNKHFTFKSTVRNVFGLMKFFISIIICYFIAYALAKSITVYMLKDMYLSTSVIEQIALIIGMGIYSVLNYFGQKFWVFS